MKTILAFLLLASPGLILAQSETTQKLHKDHDDALSLFFYNNTLRMINQQEDKQFDEIIKDIEKMKFLMIDKESDSFSPADFQKLEKSYLSESFESIMSSRYQGRNFNVYLKEKNGVTKGMIVLVNDSSTLYVLDIVGKVALDKVTQLYSTIDESSEIGKKIKSFTNKNEKRRSKEDEEGDN